MKRISFLLVTLALCAAPAARAQDAATEERLNQLNGKIEDMKASDEVLKSRIADLTKEVASLREQASKPVGNYATAEDLKRLADAVKEIDRKRIEDNDKTRAELLKLAKALNAPVPTSTKKGPPTTPATDVPVTGYPWVVQSGDTLSGIVAAYKKEKNIKVSIADIQKANPGLNPNNLTVGKTIIIPPPQSAAPTTP